MIVANLEPGSTRRKPRHNYNAATLEFIFRLLRPALFLKLMSFNPVEIFFPAAVSRIFVTA